MLSLALLTGTLGYLIVGNLSFKAHLGLLRLSPDTPVICREDRQERGGPDKSGGGESLSRTAALLRQLSVPPLDVLGATQ